MKISLTARDFDTAFQELKTKATNVFSTWTKFALSNIGVFFLELFATIIDQCSFYLNRVANETWLATVQQRRNAQKLLTRIGYVMSGPVPASVELTFSFTGGGTHTQDVTIPEGTPVETADGNFHFETITDMTITAGNPNGTVDAKHWTARSESIETDNTADQQIYLRNADFVPESEEVTIASVTWTRVVDLLDSGPTDKHYKVEYDNDMRAILIFGDGTTGQKPNGSGTVTYNTGGGADANAVQAATITEIKATIYNALAAPVSMDCTNAASPTGGVDTETIDTARVQGPREFRTLEKTVSRDDYEANAQSVSGIARCLALGHNEDAAIPAGNEYLWLVPEGGGQPTAGQQTAVTDQLSDADKTPVVDPSGFVIVTPTLYNTITPVGVAEKKDGFGAAAVKTAMDLAITTYFTYTNLDDDNNYTVDFGHNKDTFYRSELIDIIMNTEINGERCIKNITLTTPAANVSIADKEMPALGSLAGLTVT